MLPDGYIMFSDAIARLSVGMWRALPQAIPVRDYREIFRREGRKQSIVFGPRKEQAGRRLTEAAVKGEFIVHAYTGPHNPHKVRSAGPRPKKGHEVGILPPAVLAQLMAPRGTLADRIIRAPMRAACGDESLFELLRTGVLIINEEAFEAWYEAERSKGHWPSHRSRLKSSGGRPRENFQATRRAILSQVAAGHWTGRRSVAKLRGLLITKATPNVPSPDTLARYVDELFLETGDGALWRGFCKRRIQ